MQHQRCASVLQFWCFL